MVSRPTLALLCLVLGAACASQARREYYVPLGHPVSRELRPCEERGAGWRHELRCQGSYLDTVAGRTLRTVHLQLDLWRPASRPLGLPLDALRVTLVDPEGDRALTLSEAWMGLSPVSGDVSVPAWSLRTFDLFFDDPDTARPPADVVRVRWVHLDDGSALVHHECAFQRISSDHPAGPLDEPPSDRRFGYRDGWYMPGLGSLGARAPVRSQERRSHHLFHSP